MKPFDINLAKAGHKVQTRGGRSARIICYDRDFQNDNGDRLPIIALVRHKIGEKPYPYTIDGHLFADGQEENDFDLVMKPKNCVRYVNVYRDRKTGRVHTGDVYDTEDEAQHQILCLDNTEHITIQKIEWLNWDEELFKDLYKNVVDKVETEKNHMNYKNVNILVLCCQSKPKSKKDKEISEFKEEYKIMTSEVKVYWDPQKETVRCATKNISEENIFKWCPMFMALPNSKDVFSEMLFKVFRKYYKKIIDFPELEHGEDWEEIKKEIGL